MTGSRKCFNPKYKNKDVFNAWTLIVESAHALAAQTQRKVFSLHGSHLLPGLTVPRASWVKNPHFGGSTSQDTWCQQPHAERTGLSSGPAHGAKSAGGATRRWGTWPDPGEQAALKDGTVIREVSLRQLKYIEPFSLP